MLPQKLSYKTAKYSQIQLTSHVTSLSSQSRYCVSVTDRAIRNSTELAKILCHNYVYYTSA